MTSTIQSIEMTMLLREYYVRRGPPVQSIELTLLTTGLRKDVSAAELEDVIAQFFASGEPLRVVISKAGDDE
jgi:hypothetical protein